MKQITGFFEQSRLAAEAMKDWPRPGTTEDCTCAREQPLAYQDTYICAAGCPVHDPGNAYDGCPGQFSLDTSRQSV